MSEIFDELDSEINEDLRRDKILSLWNKYGKYFIALIVLIIAMIIGYTTWVDHKKAEATKHTELFTNAINQIEQGKINEAFASLKQLSDQAPKDAKILANLFYTGLRIRAYDDQKGKLNEVQEQELDELALIANNKNYDILWRDLATITSVAYEFDFLKPAELIKKLEPLTMAGRPFMFSATEMMAHLYLKEGDKVKAKELFQHLAKMKDAPIGIVRRAQLMLQGQEL